MLYAKSPITGDLIPATKESVARCPDCDSEMVPKCGTLINHHWAHKSLTGCDTKYYDGMSEWHYNWQRQINDPKPGVNIEVPIVRGEQYKRADLKPEHGVIIEFQRSQLPIEERINRETHYKDMMWVVHPERSKSKTWKSNYKSLNPKAITRFGLLNLSSAPIIFDRPRTKQMYYKEKDITITRERFIKTFINGKVCNAEVWDKIKQRVIRKTKYMCGVCLPRMKVYTDERGYRLPYHHREFCRSMICEESTLTVVFGFFNLLIEVWDTISKKETEERLKAERERKFLSDPDTLQELYRIRDMKERDHEWSELIQLERNREREAYRIKESEELKHQQENEIKNKIRESRDIQKLRFESLSYDLSLKGYERIDTTVIS